MLVATLSRLWICWFAPDAHLNRSAGEHVLTFKFFCQSVPIGVFGEAVHGIVRLLLSMRDCGRRMTFIGLTSSERLPSLLDRGRAAPPDGDPCPPTPTDRRCAASSPEPAPRYRNSLLPGRAG